MHIDTTNLNKQRKKLKKYYTELYTLDKILNHIKQCDNFDILKNHVISRVYGFERLKYELNNYFSFNLNKSGGVIRLICSLDKDKNTIIIEFISMNHYKDFKERVI